MTDAQLAGLSAAGAHAADAAGLVGACGRLVSRVHADLWMDGDLTGVEG